MKYILVITFILSNILATGQVFENPINDKTTKDFSCEIWGETDFIHPQLFPFSFENFDAQMMLTYFVEGTTVDSVAYDNGGYKYAIYTFNKDASYLSVLVKPESKWFYMDRCLIKGEFLKNKIHFGLDRNQFLDIIDVENESCNSLQFLLGETTTHYTFNFEHGKLIEMYAYSTE